MTQEQIDKSMLSVKRMAKTILFGIKMAGGRTTRRELVSAFPENWKPTRGEFLDAIYHLEYNGRITRTCGPSGYYDFGDCVLTII